MQLRLWVCILPTFSGYIIYISGIFHVPNISSLLDLSRVNKKIDNVNMRNVMLYDLV